MAKISCKKGQYYCNTDKKCKPIPEGYTVREDGFLVKEGWSAKYKKSIDCNNPKGFSQKAHCAGKKKKMTEESNPRIARKKGQPAKSKKHSDLYTDEDPKGTIHGLGFKDVATAKASVAKIRKSGRSHAHKIQAAIAMEQRARVMGKTSEAAVYRKFINSMKKKTKAMNESKHGDHEYEMIRRQTDNIMVAAKKIKKKVGKGEGNEMAWVQSKITKAADYLDTAADYMTDKENVKEGTLRSWFKGSKSKDGKGGWVNVKTGGTCASDEPGEGVPKCVSRAKYDSMSKKERESAHRRKRAADPNQQSKTGAAKPTYVSTDKPKKKKKMKEEFVSLPLQLEVPQSDGEFKCGLMFRESLERDRGMLFIFESDDYWTFHMKNTFIPLDIAFVKEDGTIDSIKQLDPMSPVPVYPESEIRYAVEVNRGWFAENGVEVGDRILEEEEELVEGKDKKGKGSGTKDACYYKVKSRYSVWPSAYASGALVKCRKVGAANWGNSRKEEVEYEVNEMAGAAKKVAGKVAKEVGKLIKQGVRKAGQAGGSAKPSKIGDTMVIKGGRRVRVATKGAPSADYDRGTFLTRQKEKLAKQKAAKKIQPDKFKEKGFEIRPVSGGGGTTIQRVNKYGVQPGIEPNTVATDYMTKKAASKLKVDPTKGKSQVKRTDFKDKDFKPKFEHYSWRDSLAEHHKKDADGNTIPHEHEDELNEMDGKLMPSNPKFKGVGATKKSNPFPDGKQNVRVFTEPQRMLVRKDTGKVSGTDLTPKEYAKKNFPSAETTKKELKKAYDKLPYYDSRGSDTLSQNRGKEGTFRKIDSMNKTFHNKRVVATAGKGSKDKDKYSSLDYSKGSKLANIRKRDVNVYMKDHYSWRDSLDEQALNMAQRRAARGSSYKAPAPTPKPEVKKPMPTTAEIRAANPGKVGGGNAGASADSGGTAQIPTRTTFTRQGKERTRAQQMAANRIAAKKSSPMDKQLSGREKAQAMAKARIASKRAESSTPTAPKPTVDKVPPVAQQKPAMDSEPTKPTPTGTPVRKVTSSTTQSGNTTSTQTNVKSGVTGGTTKDLTSSAGSLQKNKEKAKQIANTANKNAAMTGSGGTTTVGKIDFGGF